MYWTLSVLANGLHTLLLLTLMSSEALTSMLLLAGIVVVMVSTSMLEGSGRGTSVSSYTGTELKLGSRDKTKASRLALLPWRSAKRLS